MILSDRHEATAMSDASAAPAIEIQDVTKRYGRLTALDRVSLDIAPGLFVTLLGPSGCGKSTLLRAIAGFAIPEEGTIRVAGRAITHEVPHRRPVTMVFQDYALFPHMSVRENIGFGCEMKGMRRADIDRRCAEMLTLIRMPEIGRRRPDELSGGQRQRVALARALAPDPVSLLLDEPLGALDLKLRLEMQQELKAIQRRTGKTFVFVTHDQDEAMSMSDLVVVMRAGRIEQSDTPERLYSRPATSFVAGFVGAANMLRAIVREIGPDGIALEVLGERWVLPPGAVTSARDPKAGEEVTLVVRPEALRLSGDAGPQDLRFDATLAERTFFGGRAHLSLSAPGGVTLRAEARPQDLAALPERLAIHCQPADVAVIAGDEDANSPDTLDRQEQKEGNAEC